MKKLLTIAVLLISVIGIAQERDTLTMNQMAEWIDSEPRMIISQPHLYGWYDVLEVDEIYLKGELLECITKADIFQYVKECLSDTIEAEKYKGKHWKQSWYLIPYEYGFETTTKKQLERRGYKYSHVGVVGVDEEGLIEVRYYFVKEPTLKGFAKWLENR